MLQWCICPGDGKTPPLEKFYEENGSHHSLVSIPWSSPTLSSQVFQGTPKQSRVLAVMNNHSLCLKPPPHSTRGRCIPLEHLLIKLLGISSKIGIATSLPQHTTPPKRRTFVDCAGRKSLRTCEIRERESELLFRSRFFVLLSAFFYNKTVAK